MLAQGKLGDMPVICQPPDAGPADGLEPQAADPRGRDRPGCAGAQGCRAGGQAELGAAFACDSLARIASERGRYAACDSACPVVTSCYFGMAVPGSRADPSAPLVRARKPTRAPPTRIAAVARPPAAGGGRPAQLDPDGGPHPPSSAPHLRRA